MIVQEAIAKYGTDLLDYLERDAEVPTITKAGMQGDVSILRVTKGPAVKPVPASGVAVVRGENGGNTHSLHGDGQIFWDTDDREAAPLLIGRLTVPEGSEAVLAHPEHGFLSIAPGTYEIGRQREFAGEWRMVAD